MCRHNLPQIQIITSMQFFLMGKEKSFIEVQGPQICSIMDTVNYVSFGPENKAKARWIKQKFVCG